MPKPKKNPKRYHPWNLYIILITGAFIVLYYFAYINTYYVDSMEKTSMMFVTDLLGLCVWVFMWTALTIIILRKQSDNHTFLGKPDK